MGKATASIMRTGYFILYVCGGMALSAFADQIIPPSADGTLVDGGGYGVFDGVADSADWSFNQSSYEGAVTVSHEADAQVEHRMVFEFNLSTVIRPLPVVAGLKFKLRGAPRFPAETAEVQVYSFPSDLLENSGDFSAGPALLAGEVSVAAFQPATDFEVDVSDQVNSALRTTSKRMAFRLQLHPQTQSAQAFMDALDTDPMSKPSLVLYDTEPGDFNHDGDRDADDFSILVDCMNGPNLPFPAGCSACDLDGDLDVDLRDIRFFDK
jgi:hypothetical protein